VSDDEDTYCCYVAYPPIKDGVTAVRPATSGEPFRIGQAYKHKPVTQIECAFCGNTSFDVARGSYLTAIRCRKCGQELCIHEG